MTKPKGLPSVDRGVNEETLQKQIPATKQVGGVKRGPAEIPDNSKTFSNSK